MTDPEPAAEPDVQAEPKAEEQAAPPGESDPGAEPADTTAEPDHGEDQGQPEPTWPRSPAMTPAQIAEHPAAMVRVSCDGRCGTPRDLWAGDTLPSADGENPTEDPRTVLMSAAGCYEEPRACPGASGTDPAVDAFHAVTVPGLDLTSIDLTQMVSRVRGGRRDPELEPAVADSGVAPIPLLTVDDLDLAAKGEIRLPVATSPFDPPPSPMLAALGVDVENLEPTLTGLPPGATVESGTPDAGDGEPSDPGPS